MRDHGGRAGCGQRDRFRHDWRGPAFLGGAVGDRGEFGGLGLPPAFSPGAEPALMKRQGEATTIAIVATDAVLDKAQAQRMATAAHDGLARAIVPAHTPFDGDLVFAAATGARPLDDPFTQPFLIGHAAAACLARAVARAVYEAQSLPGDLTPTWRGRFDRG
ncbi:MAG: P1 family peptidase [Paracoccaceae bacterium]